MSAAESDAVVDAGRALSVSLVEDDDAVLLEERLVSAGVTAELTRPAPITCLVRPEQRRRVGAVSRRCGT